MRASRVAAATALSLLMLVSSGLPAGSVYKWMDERGRTHYGSHPPSSGAIYKLHPRTDDAQPQWRRWSHDRAPAEPGEPRQGQVSLIDWDTGLTTTGRFRYVEGALRNTGQQAVRDVRVQVRALDRRGNPVAVVRKRALPSRLAPGQAAAFHLSLPRSPDIADLDVVLRWR